LYLQARPGVYKLPATGDFIYTVTSVAVVAASDVKLMDPSNDYRLTLVTDSTGRVRGNRVLVVSAVSGQRGHTRPSTSARSLEPSTGSVIFNRWVGRGLVGIVLSAVLVYALRRRHRLALVAAVALPMFLITVFWIFLEFDMAVFRPLA
jgi:hypothetical protein